MSEVESKTDSDIVECPWCNEDVDKKDLVQVCHCKDGNIACPECLQYYIDANNTSDTDTSKCPNCKYEWKVDYVNVHQKKINILYWISNYGSLLVVICFLIGSAIIGSIFKDNNKSKYKMLVILVVASFLAWIIFQLILKCADSYRKYNKFQIEQFSQEEEKETPKEAKKKSDIYEDDDDPMIELLLEDS